MKSSITFMWKLKLKLVKITQQWENISCAQQATSRMELRDVTSSEESQTQKGKSSKMGKTNPWW